MTEYLFDAPLWLPAIVVIIGVIAAIIGNSRQAADVRAGGAAAVVLGVLWGGLTFVVDTPRKVCERESAAAVQAVVDRDWKMFDSLVAADADARFVGRNWQARGRGEIEAVAKMIASNSGLHSTGIRRVKSSSQGGLRTVAFTAYANTDLTSGYPIDSDWQFDFRQRDGRWMIQEMRVSRVDDTGPEGIRESLNKR